MRKKPPSESQLADIARIFAILSDRSRLLLLNTLRESPCYVTELCRKTGLKQANVSKQLGLLKSAELVTTHRDGNLVQYSITEPMIFDICELVCSKIERDARRRIQAFRTERTMAARR